MDSTSKNYLICGVLFVAGALLLLGSRQGFLAKAVDLKGPRTGSVVRAPAGEAIGVGLMITGAACAAALWRSENG